MSRQRMGRSWLFCRSQCGRISCSRAYAPRRRRNGAVSERPLEIDPGRNLNLASHALRREHEINHAAELMRNEMAYEIGAVTGVDLGFHRRAPELLPDQHQIGPISVRLTVPIHGYLAARDR